MRKQTGGSRVLNDGYYDDFTPPRSDKHIRSVQAPIFDHTVHITTMDDIDSHLDRIDLIRGAGPDDTVTIHINTYGGLCHLAQAYISAMKESKAQIITRGIGTVASAGTFVFLAGQYRHADKDATFMFHNYQGGTWGDGANMNSQVSFEAVWGESFMRSSYQGVLTEDEMTKILNGGQVWLLGEEIQKRLDDLPQTNASFRLRLPDGYEIDTKVDQLTMKTFSSLSMDEIHYVALSLGYDITETERVPFLLKLIQAIQDQSVASQEQQ